MAGAQSVIMNDVASKLMPVQAKKDDSYKTFERLMILCEKNFDKINKRFDISDRKLDDQNAKLDDMINEMNKRDEKWEGDRCRLKEKTKGELKQVKDFESENENNEETDDNINNEGVSTSGNYNEEILSLIHIYSTCPKSMFNSA